jgi:glycosyltransferase involved in cell wall biosynthesis
MAGQMKVSVVLPTYNRGYIIRDALESALAQSHADLEILVVDDGSTDNTREIVEQLKSEKIRFILHERNRGCSAAYNTGIAAATGQLIAFLDSDDLWKSNYLETLVSFLGRHPETDLVFCDTEILGDVARIPSLAALMKSFSRMLRDVPKADEYVFTGRQMYVCLLEEVPIKPSAALIKREMFAKAGNFDEAWPSGTDWDLFLRISNFASFGYINLPLATQRRTADATHQKFVEKDKQFLLSVFLREKQKLRNDPEALSAVNRGISSHCRNLAGNYLHSGQRTKSLAICLKGFKETGEPMMLIRAASALMPLGVRDIFKGVAQRNHHYS